MADQQMTYPNHARSILRLGLPLIGGHLGQVAIGVTDTVMLGRYGIEELAAVTLGGSFFFVLFLFGSGFAWAVMPMVATFSAEEDDQNIRRATRMGLWLSLIYAVAVLPIMFGAERILIALRQEPEVSALAAEYLAVAGLGIIPALVVMTLKSYLAALERTQIVFWMTIAAALANGLANYAFIFGNWGAPELGIEGAAIASLITQAVMVLAVVGYAVFVLPEHALFKRFWRADWPMFGRVFRLGVPIGLTTLSEVGLFTASALMMGTFGTVPLAAHGIVMNIVSMTFMVHLGLANVATIRVGNALGKKDAEHLKRGARMVIFLSVCMAILTVTAFLILPETLISLFLKADEEARDQILIAGTVLLALAAVFQLVDGTQAVALGLLRGLQDTNVPMWMAAISYWAIGVPCMYAFGFSLGLAGPGIWLGMSVGLAAAAVLLNWRFWNAALNRVVAGLRAHEAEGREAAF